MAIVTEAVCDGCGLRVETDRAPRGPMEWIDATLDANDYDFCSWGCVAAYAQAKAGPPEDICPHEHAAGENCYHSDLIFKPTRGVS